MKQLLPLLLLPLCVAAHAQGWNNPQSATFATCLVRGDNGDFWAGADDEGLFHRDAAGVWSPFAGAKLLGDTHVTSLAVDRKHRLWVGTASAGVAVFDGARWKRFGPLSGPLSARVNDLQLAPDGSMWGATDAGVFRWSGAHGWQFPGVLSSTSTRSLARCPVYALAFDGRGAVLEATDDGLNRLWPGTSGARIEALGRANSRFQPPSASGNGFLPGPVHDVAFDGLGQIWCATRYGVCLSANGGQSWKFLRGADWLANAKGNAVPLPIRAAKSGADPLAEDWVTTLSPTTDGRMWLGFRQKGAEERDCRTLEPIVLTRDDPKFATDAGFGGDWTTAILPTGGDNAVFARYGGGLASLFGVELPTSRKSDFARFALPDNARFSVQTLAQLTQNLAKRAALRVGTGAFYALDRQTRGDWPLRYGNEGAELLGMDNREGEFGADAFDLDVDIGPHSNGRDDSSYVYTHWETSQNPNVVQVPTKNRRTQSEINDGTWQSSDYPLALDGPDLWATLSVPRGLHRVALYWFNKDGHSDLNRMRDHRVELFPGALSKAQCLRRAPMAHARLWNGWNGEYASFAVRGPAKFQIRIARDRSNGTILQGVFFDHLGAAPTKTRLPARFKIPRAPLKLAANALFAPALELWRACDAAETRGAPCPLERLIALRAAQTLGAPESLLAAWRVQSGAWDEEGRDRKAVALPEG